MNHEVGDEIGYGCDICGMETAHKVINSNYIDTEAVQCLSCGTTDEYTV